MMLSKNTLFTIACSLLVVTFSSYAASQAAFVWAEDDSKGSRIFLSHHVDGQWQAKQTIIDNQQLNILPAVGIDKNNNQLVVWSTVTRKGSSLYYRQLSNGKWNEPGILTNKLSTNLAPVIVYDLDTRPWVFWAGNDGADDDIYFSQLTQTGWSEPYRVNTGNKIPDILPEAGLDDFGNVWVTWKRLNGNQYDDEFEVFDLVKHKPGAASNLFDVETIRRYQARVELEYPLEPPVIFNARSRATMYFPDEQNSPTKLFDGNLIQ